MIFLLIFYFYEYETGLKDVLTLPYIMNTLALCVKTDIVCSIQ